MYSKLREMAREILSIEADLPSRLKHNSGEQATVDDFELRTFVQTWGSTALGFRGIGGQAMTSANTYVLLPICVNQDCFVYFAGRFAYSVPMCQALLEDIKNESVASVAKRGKYLSQGEACGKDRKPR